MKKCSCSEEVGWLRTSPANLEQVEGLLEQILAAGNLFIREVTLHLLRAGGKRLRPRLLLLAGEFGRQRERLVELAVAVELLHMATLAHDDVVDESDLRRGWPTINARWDNRVSVLAGDYLFAQAFRLLTRCAAPDGISLVADVIHAMAEGEIAQVACRGKFDLTQQDYLDHVEKKTALLMAASCQLGAMAAGAVPSCHGALRRYGYNLGMAFQVIDDLLDIIADRNDVGKPTGHDFSRGVITLPLIHCLRSGNGHLLSLLQQDGADVTAVRKILQENGSLAYARNVAGEFIERARTSLLELPPGPPRESLAALAGTVLELDH